MGRQQTAKKSPQGSCLLRLTPLILLAIGLSIPGPMLLNIGIRTLTNLALQSGNPPLAESVLSFALKVKPNSAQIYDALGFVQSQQGRNDLAADSFRQAIALDAKNARAHNNLGVALLNQGELNQAIEHLKTATTLDPGNAVQYYNLANSYISVGEQSLAADAYLLASQLDQNMNDAKARLAAVLLIEGESAQASETWTLVLETDPNQALALRGMGVIACQNGDFNGALSYLQNAQKLDPYDPYTRFYTGIALEALGKLAEAEAEFEKAMFQSGDALLSYQIEVHLQAVRLAHGEE